MHTVKSLLPNKEYHHHSSIVLPDDVSCRSQGEMFGSTYYALSQLTGGVSASICDENYANQFRLIAETIISQVSEKALECVPADSNSDGQADISITSPSQQVITNYSLINNVVRFNAELSEVGTYKIKYKCLK